MTKIVLEVVKELELVKVVVTSRCFGGHADRLTKLLGGQKPCHNSQ